jgi:penicillin-binding protein 2
LNYGKYIISGIFIFVALSLITKLFYIQVTDSNYKLSAENNAFRRVTQFPARGMIFDRKGKLLVFNEATYDLKCVPNQMSAFDTIALCRILKLSQPEFELELINAGKTPYQPITVAKQMTKEDYALLQESMYKFPGFYFETRTLRKYPEALAAHMLGYVGEINQNEIGIDPYYKPGDYIGISGIEKSYEQYLRGKKGVKIQVVDVFNEVKGSYKNGKFDTAAVVGKNITTTLDADLQKYAEQLMQNKTGAVVALEPSTGEILVLVSSPTYDPNLFVGQKRSENFKILAADETKPLFNRAIKALYPPGSTSKPANALIALQEGVITTKTVFFSNFGYNSGSHIVKDHVGGSVDFTRAIQSSSNAYFCNVFKAVLTDHKFNTVEERYENWREHLHKFGLGVKLGTDLSFEKKGLIYPATYFDRWYGEGKWNHNTIISLAIGQGELGFTPLQIANMTAAIANRGYFITPHIVKSITGEQIDPKFTVKHYVGIDAQYFPPVIEAMQLVVDAGTATNAHLDGIEICGKTGTAQNPHGEDHSIFIAFAPKENPKIVIAVYVENAGFGSTWAAPIASLMIERYLTGQMTRPWLEERILNGVIVVPKDKVKKHKSEE